MDAGQAEKTFPTIEGRLIVKEFRQFPTKRKHQRKNGITLSIWTFPSPWVLFHYPATLRPNEETEELRNQLKHPAKKRLALVHNAARITKRKINPCIAKNGDLWQLHHVIPLSLGGDNETLVVAHASVHNKIHAFINLQIEKMRIGETRDILIPFQPALVWGLKPPITHYLERTGKAACKNTTPPLHALRPGALTLPSFPFRAAR